MPARALDDDKALSSALDNVIMFLTRRCDLKLYESFNINITKDEKWYATEEECRADNKIEINRF